MRQMTEFPFRKVHFSDAVLSEIAAPIRRGLRPLLVEENDLNQEVSASLVAARASEIITGGLRVLPDWIDSDTCYLVLADVPEPALFRVPTVLRVHKPDQRIHVSRDSGAMKRQAIALQRDRPDDGIVDAYVLSSDLCLVLGDLSIRCLPLDRLTPLARLKDAEIESFEIHSSGSFLWWRDYDLRLGASQLLQAVDPTHLADVAIKRYAVEKTSLALRWLREQRNMTQSDISGLSDRHVRRLENEEVRLTTDVAEKYAGSFGISLAEFLEELGSHLSLLAEAPKQIKREQRQAPTITAQRSSSRRQVASK